LYPIFSGSQAAAGWIFWRMEEKLPANRYDLDFPQASFIYPCPYFQYSNSSHHLLAHAMTNTFHEPCEGLRALNPDRNFGIVSQGNLGQVIAMINNRKANRIPPRRGTDWNVVIIKQA
jgi:hypothetical protein